MSDTRRLDCHKLHMETMLVAVRIYIAHPELREGVVDPGPLEWEQRADIAERLLVEALEGGEPPPGLPDVMSALDRIEQTLANGVCCYGASY